MLFSNHRHTSHNMNYCPLALRSGCPVVSAVPEFASCAYGRYGDWRAGWEDAQGWRGGLGQWIIGLEGGLGLWIIGLVMCQTLPRAQVVVGVALKEDSLKGWVKGYTIYRGWKAIMAKGHPKLDTRISFVRLFVRPSHSYYPP